MTRVVIAILTYQRLDALNRCLHGIYSGKIPSDVDLRVVVGNNAPEPLPETGHRAQILQLGLGTDVAGARQEMLEHARSLGADYLIFVDDDEIVSSDWLSEILKCARSFGAAAVAGPVVPLIDERHRRLGPLYSRRRVATGTKVRAAGAGNLLLRLEDTKGIDFDREWGAGGGEDTDFTTRLTESGREIVWCNEALIEEPVTRARYRLRWFWRRYFANGSHLARCDARSSQFRYRDLAVRLAVGVLSTPLVLAYSAHPRLCRLGLDYGARNLGYVRRAWAISRS